MNFRGIIRTLLVDIISPYLRFELLGNVFPVFPTVLQFPVTYKCNSKCIMCNVWNRNIKNEISVDQITEILQDKLFQKLEGIGFNGGEPTLRGDLIGIIRASVEALPNLKSVNIITNAVKPEKCLDSILSIDKYLKEKNIGFNVGVSVDGIGEIHDLNRRVKGNFSSLEKLVDEVKDAGIDIWGGCTITPINCYWVDDVLDWFREKHFKYAEFRLAVDINRLSNNGFENEHQFSREEIFHLAQFFKKIIYDGAFNWAGNRDFYKSLYDQLTKNSLRKAGCAWRYNGVTLNPDGQLSFCSVKSPYIGSCLAEKPYRIFKNNLSVRKEIIKLHCRNCKHDLVGKTPAKVAFRSLITDMSTELYDRKKRKAIKIEGDIEIQNMISKPVTGWQKVLIVGWWGTETAGDKAILGSLLNFLKQTSKNECKIAVSSIDEFVVKNTFMELGAAEPEIISIDRCFWPEVIKNVDAVIIGGGPLEDIYETHYIWAAFREAMKQGKERVIFGCGIDPNLSLKYQKLVKGLCRMATRGFFRDSESFRRGQALGVNKNFGFSCDPAIPFVKRWISKGEHQNHEHPPYIATLIRANTSEYYKGDLTLDKINNNILCDIVRVLQTQAKNEKIRLLPMHSLFIGGDDRIYNRKLYNLFDEKENISLERSYLPFNKLLENISGAHSVVAMRYHGHLFSAALGIPFVSIDYTGKEGKVSSFINRIGWQELSLSWENFSVQGFRDISDKIEKDYKVLKEKLTKEISLMVDDYEITLKRVFEL